jgi:ketosteroid isomerase-like protein
MTTTTITEHIFTTLGKGDYIGLVERSAPDVLLDMNLPTWRFQAQGQAEVLAYFAAQFGGLPPVRCTQFRVLSPANPVIVESECRFNTKEGEYLWRAVDIVQTVDDQIVEITQYCTGCWDPATVARQADEAPMVRW